MRDEDQNSRDRHGDDELMPPGMTDVPVGNLRKSCLAEKERSVLVWRVGHDSPPPRTLGLQIVWSE